MIMSHAAKGVFATQEHHFEEIAAASPSNWPPAAEQQKGAHNAATNMDAWIPEALVLHKVIKTASKRRQAVSVRH